ncbi:hypothetical protein BGZ74_004526 [Mortierella antarctica]|nr:hypothetical protein BGZ74_004526 [Mortierella antarctica]
MFILLNHYRTTGIQLPTVLQRAQAVQSLQAAGGDHQFNITQDSTQITGDAAAVAVESDVGDGSEVELDAQVQERGDVIEADRLAGVQECEDCIRKFLHKIHLVNSEEMENLFQGVEYLENLDLIESTSGNARQARQTWK